MILPQRGRYDTEPFKRPVDVAVETALEVCTHAQNVGADQTFKLHCAKEIARLIEPAKMSDEDIESIVDGADFISVGLAQGDESRMDAFNTMLLELSVDHGPDFAELGHAVFGGEYVDNDVQTLFKMAQLAVDTPYLNLYGSMPEAHRVQL